MNLWADLLHRMTSKQRPRKDRRPAPELAAYYWTNAAPTEHSIRDISSTGLYLLTEERWFPGTLVMLTLQRTGEADDSAMRSISVQSKAVRWGADGVGLEFILPGRQGQGESVFAGQAADRKTLKHFLNGFKPEEGSVIVKQIMKGAEEPS